MAKPSSDFSAWLHEGGGYSEREVRKRVSARHGFRDEPSCANWDEVEEICVEMEWQQRSIEILDLEVNDRDVLYHVVKTDFEEDIPVPHAFEELEVEKELKGGRFSSSRWLDVTLGIHGRGLHPSAEDAHVSISRGSSDASMCSWAATSDGEQSPMSVSSPRPSLFRDVDNACPDWEIQAGKSFDGPCAKALQALSKLSKSHTDLVGTAASPGGGSHLGDCASPHPAPDDPILQEIAKQNGLSRPTGHLEFRKRSANLARKLFSKIQAKVHMEALGQKPSSCLVEEGELTRLGTMFSQGKENPLGLAGLADNCVQLPAGVPTQGPKQSPPKGLAFSTPYEEHHSSGPHDDPNHTSEMSRTSGEDGTQHVSCALPVSLNNLATECASPASSARCQFKFRDSRRVYDELDLISLSPDLPTRVLVSSDKILVNLCAFTDCIGVRISGIDLTSCLEEGNKGLICLNLEAGSSESKCCGWRTFPGVQGCADF